MMKKNRTNPLIAICTTSAALMAPLALAPGVANIIQTYGVAPSVAQLPLMLPALIAIPFTILTGKLVEYISKKTLAIWGFIIITITGLLPILFPYTPEAFKLVVALRVLMGVGLGFLCAIAPCIAPEFYPEGDKRNLGMGLQGAFSGSGGFVFNILAGFLVARETRLIYLSYLVCVLLMVITIITLPKVKPLKVINAKNYTEPVETAPSSGKTFDPKALPFAIIVFVVMSGVFAVNMFISTFMEATGLGTSVEAGFATSLYSVAAFITGFAYVGLVKLFKFQIRLVGAMISGVGIIILGTAIGLPFVYVGAIMAGVGMSMMVPANIGEATMIVKPSAVPMSISIITSGNMLSTTMSPVLVGLVAGLFGGTARGHFYGAALMVIVIGLVACLHSIRNRTYLKKKTEND